MTTDVSQYFRRLLPTLYLFPVRGGAEQCSVVCCWVVRRSLAVFRAFICIVKYLSIGILASLVLAVVKRDLCNIWHPVCSF